MTQLFELERISFENLLNKERLLQIMFATSAIAGTFLPVLNPSLDRETKTLSLIYGLMGSTAFTYACHKRQRKEKIFGAIDSAQMVSLKSQMANAIAHDNIANKIQGQREVKKHILSLPEEEQAYWAHQLGLQGLIMPPPMMVPQAQEQRVPAWANAMPSGEQSGFDEVFEEQSLIDHSWIDDKFICASKGVFGAKNSGKSTWLNYEALRFLEIHPNGELRIGDHHFDEEESKWLPGVPTEKLLKKYVAKKPEDIFKIFQRAKKLLIERIDKSDRRAPKFKFICDEFVGFMSRISDEQQEEVLSAIAMSQDEGRKYGVDITLGLHSLKKQRTGVDSSVLFQMDILCLGSSLSDPSTKFPSDFDTKTLLQQQHALQATLKQNQGRAAVVRKLGEEPCVVVIPNIVLKVPQNSSNDWMADIKQWLQELGHKPAPADVAKKWQEITGQTLTEQGLKLLLENLGL